MYWIAKKMELHRPHIRRIGNTIAKEIRELYEIILNGQAPTRFSSVQMRNLYTHRRLNEKSRNRLQSNRANMEEVCHLFCPRENDAEIFFFLAWCDTESAVPLTILLTHKFPVTSQLLKYPSNSMRCDFFNRSVVSKQQHVCIWGNRV